MRIWKQERKANYLQLNYSFYPKLVGVISNHFVWLKSKPFCWCNIMSLLQSFVVWWPVIRQHRRTEKFKEQGKDSSLLLSAVDSRWKSFALIGLHKFEWQSKTRNKHREHKHTLSFSCLTYASFGITCPIKHLKKLEHRQRHNFPKAISWSCGLLVKPICSRGVS